MLTAFLSIALVQRLTKMAAFDTAVPTVDISPFTSPEAHSDAARAAAAKFLTQGLRAGKFAVDEDPNSWSAVLLIRATPSTSAGATRRLQKKFGKSFEMLGFEKIRHPRGYQDEYDVDRWAYSYSPDLVKIDVQTFLPIAG